VRSSARGSGGWPHSTICDPTWQVTAGASLLVIGALLTPYDATPPIEW
jgi:hypothetical protein